MLILVTAYYSTSKSFFFIIYFLNVLLLLLLYRLLTHFKDELYGSNGNTFYPTLFIRMIHFITIIFYNKYNVF